MLSATQEHLPRHRSYHHVLHYGRTSVFGGRQDTRRPRHTASTTPAAQPTATRGPFQQCHPSDVPTPPVQFHQISGDWRNLLGSTSNRHWSGGTRHHLVLTAHQQGHPRHRRDTGGLPGPHPPAPAGPPDHSTPPPRPLHRPGVDARFPNPPFSVRSKRLLGAIAPSDSWEHSGNPGGAGAAGHHAPTTWVHPRVYGGW